MEVVAFPENGKATTLHRRNMESIIHQIMHSYGESVAAYQEMVGLGSVNRIFEVVGTKGHYIIRLNADPKKSLEYKKEKWCIEKVKSIGIPSPEILKLGEINQIPYMIQSKLYGENGKSCSPTEKREIWKTLGEYARSYHQIAQIEDADVNKQLFHKSWKDRLKYNLKELNQADSLLKNGILTNEEHKKAKSELAKLIGKPFKSGLIHGDLCPRNTIWNQQTMYLLDWGTAEINIIPHIELGIIMTSGEATKEEIALFKNGYNISDAAYPQLDSEICMLNLLHRLDKYRWAEGHVPHLIERYEQKVRETFQALN